MRLDTGTIYPERPERIRRPFQRSHQVLQILTATMKIYPSPHSLKVENQVRQLTQDHWNCGICVANACLTLHSMNLE